MGCIFFVCLFLQFYASEASVRPKRNVADFPVCPLDHLFAFDNGKHCCDERDDADCDTNGEIKWTSTCCKGDVIPCPEGVGCEDFKSPCIGWNVAHTKKSYTEQVGLTDFNDEYDGIYTHQLTDLENAIFVYNRGVYVKDDKCIWWYYFTRTWWIGECKDVGEAKGFAYLVQDETCPYVSGTDWRNPPQYWKSSVTHQLLKGYSLGWGVIGGVQATGASGTTASSHRVFKGRFKVQCLWKFVNGRFRCLPPRRYNETRQRPSGRD